MYEINALVVDQSFKEVVYRMDTAVPERRNKLYESISWQKKFIVHFISLEENDLITDKRKKFEA